jgi:hypothetical protein
MPYSRLVSVQRKEKQAQQGEMNKRDFLVLGSVVTKGFKEKPEGRK